MRFEAELIKLKLRETFRISKGETLGKNNCILHLDNALGECCPSIYYGYSAEDCYNEICDADMELTEPFELSSTLDILSELFNEKKSLLAGLDMVVHDYFARKFNLPLYQYLGIPKPKNIESSYTISIVQPENIEERLKSAQGFKSIKLKIGSEYDHENLEIIDSLQYYKIRVDANSAYSLDEILELVPFLNKLNLELVEQPLKVTTVENLSMLRKELKAPIFLDETIVEPEDIYLFADVIDGINIKLQRVGGIRPALKMIQIAKSLGLKIMLGCMLETNIGNSAAAHLAGFADYTDLDSSYLLENDPFEGMKIENGKVLISEGNGIGVLRRIDV